MSLCNTALSTKALPTCLGVLTIGTIPDLTTAVKIVIEDVTTGRREIYDVTSSGAGVVSVDLTGEEFSDSHSYQAWIFKTTNGIDDRYAITVSGASATTEYVQLSFELIKDDGDNFAMATATLKAA